MELALTIEEEGSGRTREETVDVEAGCTVAEVLNAADIAPETVLVEHDGSIITLQDEVGDEVAELRVLSVVSGG